MSALPQRWSHTRLGDVCDVIRGITFPASAKEPDSSDGNVCCLRTSNIQSEIDWNDIYFVSRQFVKRSEQFVQPGDILMSMANSRELVGKVAVVRGATPYVSAFGAFLSAIRPRNAVDRQYLFHLLRSSSVQDALRRGSSQTVNIANISVKALADIEIPLPPLAEQQRIADKLDVLLGRVDACRARLERVPAILKRFRQAVLAAATSGKLTEEWRRLRTGATSEWRTTTFGAASSEITVGYVGKMATEYCDSGIPFLRSLNVRPFRFDKRALKFISPKFHQAIAKSKLAPGDVVIVRSGAPGQCCVIPPELTEANCSDLVIMRPGPLLLPEFACIVVNSESSQTFVKTEQVGVAQLHFNVASMKKAPLHLPTLAEQHEIVRRVETLFAYADRLEAGYGAAREQVEQLTPSLLAKAFRGELVTKYGSPEQPHMASGEEL